jgi:hypothetical protein
VIQIPAVPYPAIVTLVSATSLTVCGPSKCTPWNVESSMSRSLAFTA